MWKGANVPQHDIIWKAAPEPLAFSRQCRRAPASAPQARELILIAKQLDVAGRDDWLRLNARTF